MLRLPPDSPRFQLYFKPLFNMIGVAIIPQRHISCPPPCNLAKVVFSPYVTRICAVSFNSGCVGKPSFASSFQYHAYPTTHRACGTVHLQYAPLLSSWLLLHF